MIAAARVRAGSAAAVLAIAACSVAAQAASFDCTRARSKLNRVICSDPELSRLDETVWNTYGERIRSLTSAQYAHVRERHLTWRRSRGLYETTVEALLHEYRSHLAWLVHPRLGLEGRYERVGLASSAAHIEAEIDLRSSDGIDLRGLAAAPVALAWHATAVRPNQGGADPSASGGEVAGAYRIGVTPQLMGALAPQSDNCRFRLEFADDRITLSAEGDCGADFSGRYERSL